MCARGRARRAALLRRASQRQMWDEFSPIDVRAITPRIVVCSSRADHDVFSYAKLTQSVPSSPRAGRRIRLLVVDEDQHRPRLIGVIELASPVFTLACRDRAFGWVGTNGSARAKGLRHVMDLSTCAPVPPYTALRGGKLLALVAASELVSEVFESRYSERLAAIVATCATGLHYAQVSRLNVRRGGLYKRVGATAGYSTWMFGPETVGAARALVCGGAPAGAFRPAHVKGIRLLRSALRHCGLDEEGLLRTGLAKGVYVCDVTGDGVASLRDRREPQGAPTRADRGTRWWHDRVLTPLLSSALPTEISRSAEPVAKPPVVPSSLAGLVRDKRFWVLFDTATRPEYYHDVHKVLALPEGALIEYQYRDVRMEDEAIAATNKRAKELPRSVLVVYAQWSEFRRGDPDPTGPKPSSEMLYQATRLAKLVALWRDGEHTTFQFRLGQHPHAAPELLTPILQELAQRSALPYTTWVGLSTGTEAVKTLIPADPVIEWQKTVERLATPPMQFGPDRFLRFTPPARNRFWTPSQLRSRYPKRPGHPHARDHRYVVPERCEFGLRIATHEPMGATRGGITEPAATFNVSVPSDGPVFGPDPPSGTLRRNTDATILFESKRSAKAERKVGTVRLSSDDAVPAVQGGIGFSFALKLAAWKRALGVLIFAAGAVSIAIGGIVTNAKEVGTGISILMIAGGILVAALGVSSTPENGLSTPDREMVRGFAADCHADTRRPGRRPNSPRT
jgi:hypothetical protein